MGSSILINDAPPSATNPLCVNSSNANATSNGATNHRLLAAATVNNTLVKSSPGNIVGGYVYNTSAAVKFLKLYNKASAPVAGTDTPIMTIPIAPSAAFNLEAAFPYGISFSTGIGYALTGAVADADTTALAANDVVVNLTYA